MTLAELNTAIQYHLSAKAKATDPEAWKDHRYALDVLLKQRDKKIAESMANGPAINQVGIYEFGD